MSNIIFLYFQFFRTTQAPDVEDTSPASRTLIAIYRVAFTDNVLVIR